MMAADKLERTKATWPPKCPGVVMPRKRLTLVARKQLKERWEGRYKGLRVSFDIPVESDE